MLKEMLPAAGAEGRQRLSFDTPSRGLIGFRAAFVNITHGSGLMHRAFLHYAPFQGSLDRVRKGVLVSMTGACLWPMQASKLEPLSHVKAAAAQLQDLARHACINKLGNAFDEVAFG